MTINPNIIFMDKRLSVNTCVYCGGPPETREHIPPKIFLDSPYPEYLPVVPACSPCNNQKSLDEEYLACLLECIVCGTTEIENLEREKIKRALAHSRKLKDKIENGKKRTSEGLFWDFDQVRIESLAAKLAQGHIAYEEFIREDEPSSVFVCPLCIAPSDMVDLFSYEGEYGGCCSWPEIGSLDFIRAVTAMEAGDDYPWVKVQEGRYRYRIVDSSAVAIVIREYLGIYVNWE